MGATLPKPVITTVLERHGSKNFRVGLAELNGWRTGMEDAHVVHMAEKDGYFGILDGHGGAECSEWCAQRLHETLAAQGCPKDDAAAKRLVLQTDKDFLETGLTGGSTAAMCVVHVPSSPGGKYRLHVINAGDSRVLLSRADGTIVDGGGTDKGLTTDHKPNYPSERERIERCGGTVKEAAGGVHRVNGDLAVSRGFGDAAYKQTGGPRQEDRPVTCDPEMGHFECGPSDFLLIVCDGVSEGSFPNPEVCQLAARVLKETKGDAAKAAEAVILQAVEADSKDNVSCMIVLMGGPSGNAGPMSLGQSREFNPGSLLGSDHKGYLDAYVAMCERGGVTLAVAAEKRYALLAARKGKAGMQEEDEAEMGLVGTPEGAVGSAQRKAWFEQWAVQCREKANENEGRGGGGPGGSGGPGGTPMEKMMMMKMLLSMMQDQEGRGPPGGMDGP